MAQRPLDTDSFSNILPTPRSATSRGPLIDSNAAAQGREKAKEARQKAAADTTMRRDFEDDGWWVELARERGIRLPQYGVPPTLSKLHTWLHKLGVSLANYRAAYGQEADFIRLNPDWPLRSFVGLVLELGA